jgi:hypothetical protein
MCMRVGFDRILTRTEFQYLNNHKASRKQSLRNQHKEHINNTSIKKQT